MFTCTNKQTEETQILNWQQLPSPPVEDPAGRRILFPPPCYGEKFTSTCIFFDPLPFYELRLSGGGGRGSQVERSGEPRLDGVDARSLPFRGLRTIPVRHGRSPGGAPAAGASLLSP